MHFLSANASLTNAESAETVVVSVVRNEVAMLPHFLDHYRNAGVEGFLIIDNGSDDGTCEYLLSQPDVALFSADTEFRAADQGTDWKVAMLAHYRLNKWTVIADADEMLLHPEHSNVPLTKWLRRFRHLPVNGFRIKMLDMYPKGPLSEASLDTDDLFEMAGYVDARPFLETSLSRGPYGNSPTCTSAVRHRLMPGARPDLFVAQKVALVRYQPWMRFSTSLHYAAEVDLADRDLLFAHFKYHAAFAAKAAREIDRGQYYNNAEEYRRYVTLTSEGRDRIYDDAVSVPWDRCAEVQDLLQTDPGPLEE